MAGVKDRCRVEARADADHKMRLGGFPRGIAPHDLHQVL